jgi:protoheme IX farnesyltransferase
MSLSRNESIPSENFGSHQLTDGIDERQQMALEKPLLSAPPSEFRDWMTLTKFHISAVATSTAAMGYIAASGTIQLGLLTTFCGTLSFALAASTLNEIQERDIDAQMQRTKNRPIPSGRISVTKARLVAILLASVGCATLFLAHGALTASLGVLALFWYNGLYTPLKRISAFAVVPGSIIGALPPAIGWSAAGGDVDSPALLALCFVFFVWQVPHFWLLSLRHAKDYESAGLPTLSKYFAESQIQRLIFTWTCASVAVCGLLGVFQTTVNLGALLSIAVGGIWLIFRFRFLLTEPSALLRVGRAFGDINRFAVVIMGSVICDALIRN